MMQPRGIIKLSLKTGQALLLGIKLQALFILFTLLGGVVLGVFPALATCTKIILRRLTHKADTTDSMFGDQRNTFPALYHEFWQFYRQSFWEINGIGYIGALAIAVLVADLIVNQNVIHSPIVQYGLIVLLIMVFTYWLYVFTIYARYALHFWQYFRQALVISVAKFSNTLAIIMGSILATVVLVVFPALTFVALVPLYLTPMIWFSYRSCLHVEAVMTYQPS
ncbi:YesL family protein [Schleiferilactobacillus harbinensis]|jgi:uncharacterized membrane protein YesL|uniref:YesL family protein n=1 Tax=Schleiferilactobacillus harbinensis TaxID=304207 RepID=UPI001239FD8B|nr:DUF624 domain-containing protein [Schleiferilactobacillus harbinensis]MCI1686808.1 DUF624 domain-containing protein [Schleiferilactobacillus harbinensis]MCI1782683.1 DUF624 domain-containing protein [Schleiferilactobacillus harbinensis]MCI1849627.1 DUF624 domain-containing protein [Schleiferilactobacillus harbinensis]QEU48380.1 DUF624 domain-containing protein [Schleiferilactobacillus harbinensis]